MRSSLLAGLASLWTLAACGPDAVTVADDAAGDSTDGEEPPGGDDDEDDVDDVDGDDGDDDVGDDDGGTETGDDGDGTSGGEVEEPRAMRAVVLEAAGPRLAGAVTASVVSVVGGELTSEPLLQTEEGILVESGAHADRWAMMTERLDPEAPGERGWLVSHSPPQPPLPIGIDAPDITFGGFAPDGSRLAFFAGEEFERSDLWVVHLEPEPHAMVLVAPPPPPGGRVEQTPVFGPADSVVVFGDYEGDGISDPYLGSSDLDVVGTSLEQIRPSGADASTLGFIRATFAANGSGLLLLRGSERDSRAIAEWLPLHDGDGLQPQPFPVPGADTMQTIARFSPSREWVVIGVYDQFFGELYVAPVGPDGLGEPMLASGPEGHDAFMGSTLSFFSPEETAVIYVAYDESSDEFGAFVRDLEAIEAPPVRVSPPLADGAFIREIRFGASRDQIFYVARLEDDVEALYEVRIEDGEVGEPRLLSDPVPAGGFITSELSVSPLGDWLVYEISSNDAAEASLQFVPLGAEAASPIRISPPLEFPESLQGVSATQDGRGMLFRVSRPLNQNPTLREDLYFVDFGNGPPLDLLHITENHRGSHLLSIE